MARLRALWGSLLARWRSWSVRQRLTFAGAAALVCVGGIVAAYLILKRPSDIQNPAAAFEGKEKELEKKENLDWPMYGYDLERTRYLNVKDVAPPFHHRFLFDAGELLEFSPIYVDGMLYVMNKDAKFFAIDAGNGKLIWKRDVGQLNASAPAYADGKLYAVSLTPGHVVALRAKDGKRLWTRPLPGRSESSPLVRGGTVYVGAESGDFYALDAEDGSDVWHIDTAGSVKAGAAFHDGTLYVGDYAGHMYAIRASDGAVRWDTTDLGVGFGRSGRFYATPAVAFGRVYAGNADGRVYSFEASTGEIAWTHSTGDLVYAAPAVADTPDTPPTVYIGSGNGVFFALNADTGAEIWRSAPMGGLISGAASVIGRVVYASAVGTDTTLGFAIEDGDVVYEVDKGEYNPVISDGRRIYLTGYAGITKLTPKEEGGKGTGKGKKKGGGKGKPRGNGKGEGKKDKGKPKDGGGKKKGGKKKGGGKKRNRGKKHNRGGGGDKG